MEGYKPETQEYGALFEVGKFLSEYRKRAAKTFIIGAWALAEASIRAEDETGRKRIAQAKIILTKHPLGERLLRISRQMELSLEESPDQTRSDLARILSLKK